jgi:2',3'-cyclic-nucleotide 2'-phosphodiesterase (5'-nucleotidase family)
VRLRIPNDVTAGLAGWLMIVAAIAALSGSSWAGERRNYNKKLPARIFFSANIDGELDVCGCQIPRGGLARRAGVFQQERWDSLPVLTVDAGSFSPAGQSVVDSVKARAAAEIFRRIGYDGIALSGRELAFGLQLWQNLARDSVPILAANLFVDAQGNTPVFPSSFRLFKRCGRKMGVLGLVSDSAWTARIDTQTAIIFRSPFLMLAQIRKAAGKCDHLTVLGEFTFAEAESLAHAVPEISTIVSSGLRYDNTEQIGRTVIIGAAPRGGTASFIEWYFADDEIKPHFGSRAIALLDVVPSDSTITRLVGQIGERVQQAPASR